MKKVKLQLDGLQVATFATSAVTPERGTVRGYLTENSCAPNPASLCGHNYCNPFTEPTTISD